VLFLTTRALPLLEILELEFDEPTALPFGDGLISGEHTNRALS
jgi:hypothetical protein